MKGSAQWWSAVLACVLLSAAGCVGTRDQPATPTPQGVKVSEQANGTTVTLAVGQALAVELRSLGDGGYGPWVLTTAPAPAILRLARATHEPSTSGRLGDFGRHVFGFDAVAAGRTRLVATATRPWNGEAVTYSLDVTVR